MIGCWHSNQTITENDGFGHKLCDEWTTWPQLFQISRRDSGSVYFVSFLLHVCIALFFAMIAAVLVKFYVEYIQDNLK